MYIYTLPKTNTAPENRTSQKETSIPTIHFQVQFVIFRECIITSQIHTLDSEQTNIRNLRDVQHIPTKGAPYTKKTNQHTKKIAPGTQKSTLLRR